MWQLRNQVVVGSLFIADYKNDMGVEPRVCCNFFDGYLEYLFENLEEDGGYPNTLEATNEIVRKYDNAGNLYNWYCCFADSDPLPIEQ